MTPARSLAASVIALGFASSLTAPTPAFAGPAACRQAQNYAAQSGAEMLRIDRLALPGSSNSARPSLKSDSSPSGRSRGAEGRGESKSVTDTANGLLGPASNLPGGDLGDSGQGATGFLSGTSDLLKSVTNGGMTAPGGPLGSGGQGGGGPIRERTAAGGQLGSRGPGGGGSADESVNGVGLGETKTALIADARANAIAVGRIVDGEGALSKPLIQAAPPNSADAARHTPSGSAGPLGFGAGDLGAHAAWDPNMACGNGVGETAHSTASLKRTNLLDLLRASKISSRSATAMARDGGEPRSVAAAGLEADRLTLADGKIKLQVLKPPALAASMGTTTGGEVEYQPPTVKVTWPGGKSKTLTTAGDAVDISLDGPAGPSSESTSLGALPKLDGLRPTSALPLPSIPGLPSLATPDTESAPEVTDGVRVHVSLGDVRRATKAHAIAARASAINIAISAGHSAGKTSGRSAGSGRSGYADAGSTVVAQLSVGLLEAAAVAPEAVRDTAGAGAAAALPITGPQAGLIAVGGLGLLVAGGAALLVSRRRRRGLS